MVAQPLEKSMFLISTFIGGWFLRDVSEETHLEDLDSSQVLLEILTF